MLSQAVLSWAVLSQAVLSRHVLSQAVLSQAVLSHAVLSQAALSQAAPSRAVLSQAVLSHAVLSQAVLYHYCSANNNKGTVGPRQGFAIVLITHIFVVGGIPWVRVNWLGRSRNKPQELTGCHTYELRPSRTTVLRASTLHRGVHVLQHGTQLLLNRFFIK